MLLAQTPHGAQRILDAVVTAWAFARRKQTVELTAEMIKAARADGLAFCAANVVTDLESLYFLLTGQFPLHRFLHTYVGATVTLAPVASLAAPRESRSWSVPSASGVN